MARKLLIFFNFTRRIPKIYQEALPEIVEQGFIQILDTVYQTGKDFVAEGIPVKIGRNSNKELEQIYINFT